jgi:hypothetical protein
MVITNVIIQNGLRTSKLVVRNDAQAEILKNDIKNKKGLSLVCQITQLFFTENEAFFNRIHLI